MFRKAGCAPFGVYVQNVMETSCDALGSGSGNVSRRPLMISTAALCSAEATQTLRCELQRSTCSSDPSRSYSALSPASEAVRNTGSPRASSVAALVAHPSLRISFRPRSRARSRKADETTA
jgi:hypothetical protein